MKLVSVGNLNGKTAIITSSWRPWGRKIRRFVAIQQLTENYWEWVEVPGNYMVPYRLSFQLDTWRKAST